MSFVGVLLLWSAMQHPEFAAAARARQPTGYVQSWGTSFGTVFNDEGRGVGVMPDGSVIWTGTTLDPGHVSGEEPLVPMARVSRYSRSGVLCWGVEFAVHTPMVDAVATRALALADPTVEAGMTAPGVAYVAGRYRGAVEFFTDDPSPPGPASNDWSFVAKIRQMGEPCAPGSGRVPWVTEFTGGRNMALTVATGRVRRILSCGSDDAISTGVFGSVVVGGFFEGTVWFGGEVREATPGTEDGYIALLSVGGVVTRAYRLGGEGHQRVTALAIDERTQDLIVAGYFTSGDTDFRLRSVPVNPPGSAVKLPPGAYAGGRDLFVARYRINDDPEPAPLWVYAYGTAGDDEAACVALGVDDDESLSTLAFVGGWTTTPGGGRDLYFAAIKDDGAKKWTFNPVASGDDRVLGVSVDGLGRPVFVGQFGCPHAPTTACAHEAAPIDFDPSEAGSLVLTPDFLDAFVVRFHPTEVRMVQGEPRPRLDWAYRIGGGMEESASAVAFDPAYTGRFALTGWFGRPDAAPGQYTIDLDPGPGVTPVTSAGFADSFLSVLAPAAPEHVGFQISLVLDNSVSMFCEPSNFFHPMLECLRDQLSRSDVIPSAGSSLPGGGGVRQAAVQVNAVLHTTKPILGRQARVVMPWTVIDDQTRPLFARRLAAVAVFAEGDSTNRVSDGLYAARDHLAESGVAPDQVYAGVLVIGNEPGDPGTPAARWEVWSQGMFDRVCSLGARTAQRATMLETLIAPVVENPRNADDIDRRSTGIAAWSELIEPPPSLFNDLMGRMLQRLSWCPSDFNRDECTDENGNPATDDFMLWYQARQHLEPYTDWNMDGHFDINIDPDKLNTGFEGLPPRPNRRVCNACPIQ